MVYLLGVVMVAARFGRGPSVTGFAPERGAIRFLFRAAAILLCRFGHPVPGDFRGHACWSTLIIGNLTASVRHQAGIAGHRERRTPSLYAMSRELAATRGEENIVRIAVKQWRSV